MTKSFDMHTRGRAAMRALVLLALATVGIAAGANAAQAAVVTNETQSLAFSGYVPCANGGAGEILTGTVEAHNLITSTANGNHASDQFQFQLRGSMTGTATGDTYRVAAVTRGTSTGNLASEQATLTYVNTYRLIGPGPGNNLLVREIAHVTRDGDDVVVAHDNLSIDCK